MNYLKLLVTVFVVFSSHLMADDALDKELADKCFSVFNIIKTNNVNKYLSMYIQSPDDEKEKGYLVKKLGYRHNWYVNKHSGWKSLEFKYVEYEKPEKWEVLKYLTNKIAFSYFRLTMSDKKETKVATQCKFAKVKDKWLLMKLP